MQSEPDGELRKLNAKYRDSVFAVDDGGVQEASRKGMELLARLLRSGVVGSILTRFGAVSGRDGRTQGDQPHRPGLIRSSGDRESGADVSTARADQGRSSLQALKSTPDYLEVRKRTFKQGATEWVVVRTNAYNDWDDHLTLRLPDFLTAIDRVPLTGGRVSYYVKCARDAALGSEGRIVATLERKKARLPALVDQAKVTVIKSSAGLEKPLRPKTTLPLVQLIPVEPNGLGWEHIDDQAMRAEQVAFNIIEEADKVSVYWNKFFPAFTSALDEIMRRYKSPEMASKFKLDYQTHISVLTLAALENNLASGGNVETDPRVAHRMRGEAVIANAMIPTMVMSKDDGDRFETEP